MFRLLGEGLNIEGELRIGLSSFQLSALLVKRFKLQFRCLLRLSGGNTSSMFQNIPVTGAQKDI